ncbi:MAG: NAD(P)-dependent oxidoreductase [Deltaproteobacteria bacterium]|nr:NAD(P)-dependent oxidoreductase [Deltaproteobacteria bacterium]MBW2351375.1 NAD(P)-dependent oxidoreductase [Deltaproteobacteria bacterium]
MNVFVTGGTGYIGSTFISRLTGEKEILKVVALARNTEKARDLATRVEFREKLEFADGDLRHCDYDFGNIDVIIHAATVHDMAWVDTNIAEAIDINVGGTLRIVQAARRFKVPYLVFFSSHSVYGKQDTMPVREDFTLRPEIPKAMTKYAGEVIVRSLANCSTKFVILRPEHVYGVGVLPHWHEFTVKYTELSCNGKNLPIYGDGNQKVDLVHVRDVCDCIYKLLMSPEDAWNETYNVGGGRVISINELADLYIQAAVDVGLKAPDRSYVEAESYCEARGFRLPWLDISKAREKLGWTPSTSIEEGVKELVQAAFDSHSNC